MVFTVALTGGIASGKSTVARLFANLNVPVIDTDVLAREVVVPKSVGWARVRDHFGASVLAADGRLDRAALRQRIFSNPEDKQALEAILHPLIRDLVAKRSAQAPGPYQIIEIPLLVESKQRIPTSRVLVVDCAEATQIRRLLARDGSSAEQARQIIAQQATREARLALADDVIVNEAGLETLSARVLELHAQYLTMADALR